MTTAAVTPTEGRPLEEHQRSRSHIGARLGAVSLILGAGLEAVQGTVERIIDRPDSVAGQIALASDHPTAFATVTVAAVLAVPFLAIGFIAAAQELARRSRKVAFVAGGLLTLGMWGYLAVQTADLFLFAAMSDPANESAATYLDSLDDEVLLGVVYSGPFLIGSVVGLLVLTIAMLVRGGVPRWIPGAWLAYLVLDFGFFDPGPVDPSWLLFAGAVGLAAHLLRGRVTARP